MKLVGRNGLLLVIAGALLVGCADAPPASPSPSVATIRLRSLADSSFCPAAAVPSPFTIRIDPTGREYVFADTPIGRFEMRWEQGFMAGPLDDPVVRDPAGAVVARDGEVVVNPPGNGELHGHALCSGSETLYVLLDGP